MMTPVSKSLIELVSACVIEHCTGAKITSRDRPAPVTVTPNPAPYFSPPYPPRLRHIGTYSHTPPQFSAHRLVSTDVPQKNAQIVNVT